MWGLPTTAALRDWVLLGSEALAMVNGGLSRWAGGETESPAPFASIDEGEALMESRRRATPSIAHKLTMTMSNPFLLNAAKVHEYSSQKTGFWK